MVGCSADTFGQSNLEKKVMTSYSRDVIEKIDFKRVSVFDDFVNQENLPYHNFFKSDQNKKYVANWFNGYAMLNSDRTLINYMVSHGYLSNENQPVQGYHGIKSKERKLS